MPCENYIIPLQKVYDNKPRTRRANNAITVIYDFFKKHSGTTKSLDEVLGALESMRDHDDFIKFLGP